MNATSAQKRTIVKHTLTNMPRSLLIGIDILFLYISLKIYIWLLIYILREMYRKSISIPISNDRGILVRVCFTMVLFCALVAFMSVHITSPYLNHPLGIGMVVLCLITAVANTSQNSNN